MTQWVIARLISLAAITCTLLAVGACDSAHREPLPILVEGSYGPDPDQVWFAGYTLSIQGDRFEFDRFSDAADDPDLKNWPIRGTFKYRNGTIYFRHPRLHGAKRIVGRLEERPVLWTPIGYERWRTTDEVLSGELLYFVTPSIDRK